MLKSSHSIQKRYLKNGYKKNSQEISLIQSNWKATDYSLLFLLKMKKENLLKVYHHF